MGGQNLLRRAGLVRRWSMAFAWAVDGLARKSQESLSRHCLMSVRQSFAPICGHKKTRIISAATPSGLRVNTRLHCNELLPHHQTRLTWVDGMRDSLFINQKLALCLCHNCHSDFHVLTDHGLIRAVSL